jgi:hypothetical protein
MAETEAEDLTFLNRDHIISVVVHRGEIVVMTTPGTQITIPTSATTLEKFVDELANHVERNFVAIAAARARRTTS